MLLVAHILLVARLAVSQETDTKAPKPKVVLKSIDEFRIKAPLDTQSKTPTQ